MSSALEAIRRVLADAGEPLHYKEITRRILDGELWETDGKTPEATVNAQLAVHIKKHGKSAKFRRAAAGIFALNGSPATAASAPTLAPPALAAEPLSFTDAAERVLHGAGDKQPKHYRAITAKALDLGLIKTSGRTPEATLYASIIEEIQRYKKRGEQPRFLIHGKGMIGLAEWVPSGIPSQVEQHNREVREQLHKSLMAMKWDDFQELVGIVLGKLGFVDVSVTPHKSDKGIDVRGTLVIEESIRVRMAVQVKKWKHNVQSPEVQKVRGSLGAHEHGLIITTSDFSPGARAEATRSDAVPIGLMNGKQFLSLLLEKGIGVRKSVFEVFEIDSDEIASPDSSVEDL